jgi:hypothetical protein
MRKSVIALLLLQLYYAQKCYCSTIASALLCAKVFLLYYCFTIQAKVFLLYYLEQFFLLFGTVCLLFGAALILTIWGWARAGLGEVSPHL